MHQLVLAGKSWRIIGQEKNCACFIITYSCIVCKADSRVHKIYIFYLKKTSLKHPTKSCVKVTLNNEAIKVLAKSIVTLCLARGISFS